MVPKVRAWRLDLAVGADGAGRRRRRSSCGRPARHSSGAGSPWRWLPAKVSGPAGRPRRRQAVCSACSPACGGRQGRVRRDSRAEVGARFVLGLGAPKTKRPHTQDRTPTQDTPPRRHFHGVSRETSRGSTVPYRPVIRRSGTAKPSELFASWWPGPPGKPLVQSDQAESGERSPCSGRSRWPGLRVVRRGRPARPPDGLTPFSLAYCLKLSYEA